MKLFELLRFFFLNLPPEREKNMFSAIFIISLDFFLFVVFRLTDRTMLSISFISPKKGEREGICFIHKESTACEIRYVRFFSFFTDIFHILCRYPYLANSLANHLRTAPLHVPIMYPKPCVCVRWMQLSMSNIK